MGERVLTVRDRIIVHLSAFGRYANEYECPEEMCQSGISVATGKSRAHITLELNRMKDAGLITERNAHVKGARSKRKTYLLTPMGQTRFSEINGYLDSLNIEIIEPEGTRFLTGNEAADHLRKSLSMPRIMAVDSVLASGGVLVMAEAGIRGADVSTKYLPARPEMFVPRNEMGALLSMAREDRPNTGILLGIPGIGKTALLSELAWSMEQEAAVMYRKLYPYDSPVSVLSDMGDFLAGHGSHSLKALMSNPAHFDMAEAGFSLCCTLSGKRYLMIFDGYEQLPTTMMPMFSMLAEQVRGSGSCIIVSSTRKGDFYSLKDLALEGHVRELVMGPMNPREAEELLGKELEGRDGMLEAAGGHPLTLRLLASGISFSTLAGFVEDEILGKDTELARLCRFASVIRKPFMPDDLEIAGFKAAGQVRQNLAFEPQPGGGYLLHPAISSIMLAATGKRMLKELHSRAADFYGQADDGAHERLHHLVRADRLGEAREAILKAGDGLLDSRNPEELAGMMELVLWGNGEDPALKVLAAGIFDRAGKRDRASKMAQSIMKEAPETTEAVKAGIIHAKILAKAGNLKGALAALDGIKRPRLSARVRAEHQYARASTLRKLGRNKEAMDACGKAIATAGKAGETVIHGQCLMENAMIMAALGRQEKALDALGSAMEVFAENHSEPDLIRCSINKGMLLRSAGRDDEAIETLEKAVKMAGEAGLHRFRAHGLANLTDLLNRKKEFRHSEELAGQAAEIFSGLREPLMQAAAMFNLCAAKAGLGKNEEAIDIMEKALAMLEENDLLEGRTSWVTECADILRGIGEEKRAAHILKRYANSSG